MEFDNDLVVGKLRRWEKYLAAYRLPAWEQIPDLGLYMEQVVLLLRQYLDYLPPELKQPEPITAAAINNYVRTRLLPEPRKKRYYRVHIAYLIMICTLKQALRLSELQTLLPGDLPEDEVRRTYDAYVRRHQLCAQYFIDQVRLTAAAMFDREVTMELAVRDTPEMITSASLQKSSCSSKARPSPPAAASRSVHDKNHLRQLPEVVFFFSLYPDPLCAPGFSVRTI